MILPGTWRIPWWWAHRLWRRGNYEAAVRVARAYATRRRKDPYGWVLWGMALMHADRAAEAEEVLQRGLELHPDSPDLLYTLATTLIALSRLNEARSLLNRLLKLERIPPSALLALADIDIRQAKWHDASEHISSAIKLAPPDDAEFKARLASAMLEVPGQWERGLELLEKAARELPRDPWPQLVLAVALERTNPEASQRHMEMARGWWRDEPSALSDHIDYLRARFSSA